MGIFQNDGIEVILVVGEHLDFLETVIEALHDVLGAGLDGRILEQGKGVKAGKSLVAKVIAERLGHGHAPLLIDLVDVPSDQKRHFGPQNRSASPAPRRPQSGAMLDFPKIWLLGIFGISWEIMGVNGIG